VSEPTTSAAGESSRRDFLKTSGVAVAGGALAGTLGIAKSAHAASSDTVKVALIGCGGRGSGAAGDCLSAKESVRIVAMADLFEDMLKNSFRDLKARFNDRIDVTDDRKFVGFDAYQKAIDAGCDMVILATPPGFRPIHFEAAVKAGKHVFMEKPVATDAPGVRQVLAAAEESKKKNLAVGVGLQRRHQKGYIETIKRLQDGAIGDILAARVYWNGTTPWVRTRAKLAEQYGRPLTEMEYQCRNWYYFTWICGDHICEQHIHNMDVINWLKNGHPVKANGMGGCEVRKGKDYGETFDHHFVEFEYADGSRMFSQCRHIEGCWSSVSEHVHGANGTCDIGGYRIRANGSEVWRHNGRGDANPYRQEHVDLLESIAAGKPINEAEYGAHSTMTAILGRMCTYSGVDITWEDALNSTKNLLPTEWSFNAVPPVTPGADGLYARAVPGIYDAGIPRERRGGRGNAGGRVS
jgi:myo-inositol 2-dehydrogenase / D-chiro-inositol 1-dehydrogenase